MKQFYAMMLAVGFLTMGAIHVNGSATVSTEPPYFISGNYEMSVAEDSNAIFSFRYTGVPEPFVEVYKNGRKINFNDSIRYRLSCGNGIAKLTIYWVIPEDAGEYTFVLKNIAGTASRTVKMYVRKWNH